MDSNFANYTIYLLARHSKIMNTTVLCSQIFLKAPLKDFYTIFQVIRIKVYEYKNTYKDMKPSTQEIPNFR